MANIQININLGEVASFDDVVTVLQRCASSLSDSTEPLSPGEMATVFDFSDLSCGSWVVKHG